MSLHRAEGPATTVRGIPVTFHITFRFPDLRDFRIPSALSLMPLAYLIVAGTIGASVLTGCGTSEPIASVSTSITSVTSSTYSGVKKDRQQPKPKLTSTSVKPSTKVLAVDGGWSLLSVTCPRITSCTAVVRNDTKKRAGNIFHITYVQNGEVVSDFNGSVSDVAPGVKATVVLLGVTPKSGTLDVFKAMF